MPYSPRILIVAATLGVSHAALAQLSWPDVSPRPMPGVSVGPVKTSLPADTNINLPAADLPATRSRWSGTWAGWACGGAACDTKLAVETVTPEGATIIYALGSASVKSASFRVEAKFIGEELHATLPSGSRIAYRFREDNYLDFLWVSKSNNVVFGVLSKEK